MAKKPKIDIKELNQKYKSININKFYNEDYADFAIYRALQRIPNLVDGFAQTQRKTIYACVELNQTKKINVSDLASDVKKFTKYHHGINSIETTITNLVPPYNNQVPLLKEDGTYGCRSEREASASRYIETRLQDYTKILFNDIDNTEFVVEQFTEGKKIEPLTMIPLLPLLLINGQSQIGVGYACDVLPRDVNKVIKVIEDILKGKSKTIPSDIPPIAPRFNGTITKDGSRYYYKGLYHFDKKKLVITEVPPKYTRTSYIKILESLKDKNKIKNYDENIVSDDFEITITFNSDVDITKLEDSKILNMFNLVETQSENLTVINTKNEIKRYESIAEILYEYIVFILGVIKKRKEFILKTLENNAIKNKEKIRFITLFNDDKIILKNKSNEEITKELEQLEFVKFDDCYDYLLNMRISNLTLKKIEELNDIIKSEQKEIDELKDKTAANLWLEDIQKIKKQLKGIIK